jgi:hypothetical protein
LSQARLDTAIWRLQRYFLTHPAAWAERRHLGHAGLPAAAVQEQFARLRLIELGVRNAILTGQVRQLETVVGTALLRTGPDGCRGTS